MYSEGDMQSAAVSIRRSDPPITSSPTPAIEPPLSNTPSWRAPLKTVWQWQLSNTVDLSVNAEMVDIELFDNDMSVVAALHRQGLQVVKAANTKQNAGE
jgi:Glycoside-hydrolase family GH114